MMPSMRDVQIEQLRTQIEQLKGGIAAQTTAFEITRRKIEAMREVKKMLWRVYTTKVELARLDAEDATNEKRIRVYKDRVDSLIELRRAESSVKACEIEQAELHHEMEGRNLDAMKEQLGQMEEHLQKMIDPSPLLTAHLNFKPSKLS
jgi:hypothetical protein